MPEIVPAAFDASRSLSRLPCRRKTAHGLIEKCAVRCRCARHSHLDRVWFYLHIPGRFEKSAGQSFARSEGTPREGFKDWRVLWNREKGP